MKHTPKILIPLFIIGGTLLAYIFNPYIGVLPMPIELHKLIIVISQFAVGGYVFVNYVFPHILKAVKDSLK